jgi:hypothetical protein
MKKLNQIANFRKMFKGEKLVFTGTFALELMGIVPPNTPGDVDVILVDPSVESMKLLKRMGNNQNTHNDTFFKITLKGDKNDDVKFDVFIIKEKSFTEKTIEVEGFTVMTLPNIIKSKKGYNRAKDIIQLLKWRDELFGNDQWFLGQMKTCQLYTNYGGY